MVDETGKVVDAAARNTVANAQGGRMFCFFPKDFHASLMLSLFNFLPSFQMSVKLPRYGDCKFYTPPYNTMYVAADESDDIDSVHVTSLLVTH